MKSCDRRELVLLVLCVIIASGAGSTGSKYYKHFNFGLTWMEAQHFCKSYYTDLVTITSVSEKDSLDLNKYWVWVGLYKEWRHYWKWSDGAYYYGSDWAKNEPKWENCAAVFFGDKKLYASDCGTRLRFVCWDGNSYTFVNETKTWSDAFKYCKTHNKNLASFTSSNRNDIFTEKNFPVWVGLHREDVGSFSWSSGSASYQNWAPGEPSNGNCVTVSSLTKLMATKDCNINLPFVCMWDGNVNVLVVREKKSWEEALEHCRGLSDNRLHFDLVSVQPGEDQYTRNKAMEADTEEVWTGLRFLGDEWLWVNGANVSNTDLPQCPIQGQRCGALSKNNTESLVASDCSERKNFLCYSFS